MLKYALKRFVYMIITLFIITFLCFLLIRLLPPAELPAGDPHTEVILARREAMGYNKPIITQFALYIKAIFTKFDWGISDKLYFGKDVAQVFMSKLPASMIVNLYSIIWTIPIGILLGMWAALKKNTMTDHVISTVTMLAISVPSFVYAFLVQYFLSYKLSWFPFLMKGGTDYFSWPMFVSMVPAVLSLSFGVVAGFTRITRAELTEALTSDYMLLARAKGLTKAQATLRHALKNCMVIVVPMIFGEFIGILGGSLIIEKIFGIPGVGILTLNSINALDYPMFMMTSVFYVALGLVSSIVVDIGYSFIDPRITVGSRK
ncbi:MAG: ABC transporter permease [Lachnospiraceae bacterium]|nr:ABC transporter permease [Lachnospiraceae bacterium]